MKNFILVVKTSVNCSGSAGVDRPSHDALQAEVLRLEASLGDVRRDIQVLSECQNGLERIQQLVREEFSNRMVATLRGTSQ